MRRFFPTLLTLILSASLFLSGCSLGKADEKLSVKESLNANYSALTTDLNEVTEFSQVTDYLAEWAKKEKIKVKKKSKHYIILSKPASENYNDADSMTLQCSLSLDTAESFLEDTQCVSILLATLYSAEYHGALEAIITEQKEGKPVGATELERSFLRGDNFVSLNYSEDAYLGNEIAATTAMKVTHPLKMNPPSYTKAFRISISGPSFKSPYLTSYPNAITTISELLASCKSSGVLFELAGFSGGQSPDLLPNRASAIVVIQENDVLGFTTKFEKSYDKTEELYHDVDESFSYTMNPAPLPHKVIQVKDTDNIISLLYTLINGTYFITEDNVVLAKSSIGTISTKNHSFKMQVDAKSLDSDIIAEMNNVFKTTCGLSDMQYLNLYQIPLWTAKKNSPLMMHLAKKRGITPEGIMENIDGTCFYRSNPKLNMAICGTNKKDGVKLINGILEYTSGLLE